MTEEKEKSYGACEKPGGHGDHLCLLMERGLTEAVRERSKHPAYVCGNCGIQAERAEDLCNPKPP